MHLERHSCAPLRFLIILMALSTLSCGYRYRVALDPSDATLMIDGAPADAGIIHRARDKSIHVEASRVGYLPYEGNFRNANPFACMDVPLELQKRIYRVTLDALDGISTCSIDGSGPLTTPADFDLEYGSHHVTLAREGFGAQSFRLDVDEEGKRTIRQQPDSLAQRPIGVFPCGRQPKQVVFSPDSKYIYVTLLDGDGFQIFDVEKRRMASTVMPDGQGGRRGFVEGIFVERHNAFLLSQMTADMIYEYDVSGEPVLLRKIPSGGIWPKVMAYCQVKDIVAVSNWVSGTVVIIDYASGAAIKTLSGLSTPRGIAFTHDGEYLVVASFDGGFVKKISTSDWTDTGTIRKPGAAMRHVVISKDDSRCWVSDMAGAELLEIEMDGFSISRRFDAYANTNSICLSPDEKTLYASNRGPNDPVSYLNRSPENGRITVIDLLSGKALDPILGGNQPTGLDVSRDGRYLCFSNFLDASIELYGLDDLPVPSLIPLP